VAAGTFWQVRHQKLVQKFSMSVVRASTRLQGNEDANGRAY
jgi:hypothetical protein